MTACKHRWRIETPAGLTSPGRCHHCGEEREFLNVSPADLENDWTHSQKNARDAAKKAADKVRRGLRAEMAS